MRLLMILVTIGMAGAVSPAVAQDATLVPIEPQTALYAHRTDPVTIKLVNTLTLMVRGKGLPCRTVSAAGFTTAGFKLVCDHLRDAYDIDVSGTAPVVTKGN